MANDVPDQKPRSRWWEDYLVRYLTGTLVGTLCVFVLLTEVFFGGEIGSLSKRMFFSPEKDSTWLGLIVLTLAGGAYCYLASVPITVFHAGRMLRAGMNKHARLAWKIWWILFAAFFVFATLAFTKVIGSSPNVIATILLLFGTAPLLWVFLGQIDVIYRLKKDQDLDSEASKFKEFYRALVKARDASTSSSIRESYTHMREHANSVFIVVIELSLLAFLLGVWKGIGDQKLFSLWTLAFLMLWTSPNILLWGLANSLEEDLSKKSYAYKS